jgi:hypothetical protein
MSYAEFNSLSILFTGNGGLYKACPPEAMIRFQQRKSDAITSEEYTIPQKLPTND